MKKTKFKIMGTSNRKTRKCIQLEFVTYIPRTDITYAKSYMSTTYRGIK